MEQQPKIFETSDVDLATFLIMEGITLLELTTKKERKNYVILRFLDDKGNCLDLERVFLGSPYKKFRDINKYVLRKIHAKIKETEG